MDIIHLNYVVFRWPNDESSAVYRASRLEVPFNLLVELCEWLTSIIIISTITFNNIHRSDGRDKAIGQMIAPVMREDDRALGDGGWTAISSSVRSPHTERQKNHWLQVLANNYNRIVFNEYRPSEYVKTKRLFFWTGVTFYHRDKHGQQIHNTIAIQTVNFQRDDDGQQRDSLGRFARHNEQITLNAIQMRFGTQYLEVRDVRSKKMLQVEFQSLPRLSGISR